MIRFFKRLIGFAVCIVVALALVRFGPTLWQRVFVVDTQWISERFSETLREKNELVVYEVEVTGQETVSQDAWLLGTVQKVEMPYTFQMSFTVNLSQAVVSALDGAVEVRLPMPSPAYPKLTVNEDEVKDACSPNTARMSNTRPEPGTLRCITCNRCSNPCSSRAAGEAAARLSWSGRTALGRRQRSWPPYSASARAARQRQRRLAAASVFANISQLFHTYLQSMKKALQ